MCRIGSPLDCNNSKIPLRTGYPFLNNVFKGLEKLVWTKMGRGTRGRSVYIQHCSVLALYIYRIYTALHLAYSMYLLEACAHGMNKGKVPPCHPAYYFLHPADLRYVSISWLTWLYTTAQLGMLNQSVCGFIVSRWCLPCPEFVS